MSFTKAKAVGYELVISVVETEEVGYESVMSFMRLRSLGGFLRSEGCKKITFASGESNL